MSLLFGITGWIHLLVNAESTRRFVPRKSSFPISPQESRPIQNGHGLACGRVRGGSLLGK